MNKIIYITYYDSILGKLTIAGDGEKYNRIMDRRSKVFCRHY